MVRDGIVQLFGDKRHEIWIKIAELWISEETAIMKWMHIRSIERQIQNVLSLTKITISVSSESDDQKQSYTNFKSPAFNKFLQIRPIQK